MLTALGVANAQRAQRSRLRTSLVGGIAKTGGESYAFRPREETLAYICRSKSKDADTS